MLLQVTYVWFICVADHLNCKQRVFGVGSAPIRQRRRPPAALESTGETVVATLRAGWPSTSRSAYCLHMRFRRLQRCRRRWPGRVAGCLAGRLAGCLAGCRAGVELHLWPASLLAGGCSRTASGHSPCPTNPRRPRRGGRHLRLSWPGGRQAALTFFVVVCVREKSLLQKSIPGFCAAQLVHRYRRKLKMMQY